MLLFLWKNGILKQTLTQRMWFVKLKIIICLDKTGEARMEEKQEKYSFGFVVLHYGGMDVTKQCISCVEKLYGTDIPIAIVDNHSPDQSGEKHP